MSATLTTPGRPFQGSESLTGADTARTPAPTNKRKPAPLGEQLVGANLINSAELESALKLLAASLEQASRGLQATGFTLLLENTAGGGSSIGRSFEELKALRDMVAPGLPFPVAFCLDTCHLYASGFDIVSEKGLEKVVTQADSILGLDLIPVIHANDSKCAFDSHLDRHANIGAGHIGLEGFRRILNHPKLRGKAFILETPIDEPGDDQRNVDALKSLCRNSRTTIKKSN